MNLDDVDMMNSLDPARMISHIRSLPDQIQEASNFAETICVPEFVDISLVLIAGSGSSYTAARLLQSYLSPTTSIPIHVINGFELPGWVQNSRTLLIISGCTGEDSELLKLFSNGLQPGRKMMVLANGGQLIDLAQKKGFPFVKYSHTGPARTALPYGFFLPLSILQKSGVIPLRNDDVSSTIEILKRTIEQIDVVIPTVRNPAKRMAGQFLNRWVTLFASGFMEIVAERWKSQIHKNAKAWAQVENIPQICHSTVFGIYNPETHLSHMMTLFLQSDCDHPSNLAISKEVRKMFMVEGFNTDNYITKGSTPLECMWNAILFGDFISYYLAMAYGVDPTTEPGAEDIDFLLNRL